MVATKPYGDECPREADWSVPNSPRDLTFLTKHPTDSEINLTTHTPLYPPGKIMHILRTKTKKYECHCSFDSFLCCGWITDTHQLVGQATKAAILYVLQCALAAPIEKIYDGTGFD